MSRIGNLPVPVPAGVEVKIHGSHVKVKGPKGELDYTFPPAMAITLEELNRDHNPDSASAHGTLGRGYELTGRLGEALASYRKALELDPESGRVAARLQTLEDKMKAEKPE